eukprot:Gb_40184 [translate_table: standard]
MQTPEIASMEIAEMAIHSDELRNVRGQSLAAVGSEGASQMCTEYGQLSESSDIQGMELVTVPSETERQHDNVFGSGDSLASNSMTDEVNPSDNSQLPGNEGFSTREPVSQEADSASVLHVEAVSLSSSEVSAFSGDVSSQEARRTSRRRLWDALTRATPRRRTISPTIVLSTEDMDDLGSSHDRWLLDFSGGLNDDPFGDDGGLIIGHSHDFDERRWHVGSQVWALQRLGSGSDGGSGHSRRCASGLHLEGRCSCEAYVMTEETSTRTSISRIVMLAEALFEVLDEIHRQSVALSSTSLVSLPAPDDVVDSFPLRIHKKSEQSETVNEEESQCYICLVEYEDGEQIRILPCHHEYHMACVDKWLKEVHRVCPLCRGNVCELNAANMASNS